MILWPWPLTQSFFFWVLHKLKKSRVCRRQCVSQDASLEGHATPLQAVPIDLCPKRCKSKGCFLLIAPFCPQIQLLVASDYRGSFFLPFSFKLIALMAPFFSFPRHFKRNQTSWHYCTCQLRRAIICLDWCPLVCKCKTIFLWEKWLNSFKFL